MTKLSIVLISLFICASAYSQKAYFVDGYHGGVYGHYPVEWKTNFLVDQLAAHPEWRISLEIEPETWDTVRVRTPRAYEAFRKIAADSRVEFTNPAYAQPYCYNISGESIIRHFSYGMRKLQGHFPDVAFTTYSVEEPCFTSSLPQILRQFGFSYAVLKCPNTCWGGYTAPYGGELVNWIGPDGTAIPAVPRYACEELEKNTVWQTAAWGNTREYLNACRTYGIENPVGMCFQDAGWGNGPWIGSGNTIKNGSIYVTWKEYMEEVTDVVPDDDYHMPQEDIRVSLMWGSEVLRTIARQVRESENRVAAAEKMSAIAYLANGYRCDQEEMDEAWRALMLSQHHDSWIVPYNRLNGRATWAQQIGLWTASANSRCDAAVSDAQQSFRSGATVNNGDGFIRVFNTLGVARKETVSVVLPERFRGKGVAVRDCTGKKVASITNVSENNEVRLVFEMEIPPFGYSTYCVSEDNMSASVDWEVRDAAPGDVVIENGLYRIVFDAAKGGTIKSLVAKKDGRREFADTASEYALGELRGFFYDEGRFRSSAEIPAEITILKDDRFEKSVRISGTIASHPFTQTVTIREGQRRIDFDLSVEWQGNPGIGEYRQHDAYDSNRRAFYDDRFKLNVMFPAAIEAPVLYKNAPFDVCESTLADTHFNTWDGIKHNVILNWVDIAENGRGWGLALLSDHTTSYSFGGDFPLALTAQYSGGGLWGCDYGISGPLEMKFALIPHKGRWDAAGVSEESLRWNEPLICGFTEDARPEARSFVDLTGTGYEISAAYPTDEGMVLRLFNASGDDSVRKIRLGFEAVSVEETDLRGNITTLKEIKHGRKGSTIEVAMPRFGLKTFLITKKS